MQILPLLLLGLLSCKSSTPPKNEECLTDSSLKYPEFISNPVPYTVYEGDLADGVTQTWTPESQPAIYRNCDQSFDNLNVTCRFRDEELEGTFAGDGFFSITKTLYEEMNGPVTCDITDNSVLDPSKSTDSITIYGGEFVKCDDPYLSGSIERSMTDLYEGDPVTFTYPLALAEAYDGITPADTSNDARFDQSYYVIENQPYVATIKDDNFTVDYLGFSTYGDQTITLNVVDADCETTGVISTSIYVKDSGSSTSTTEIPTPSLALEWSAQVGTVVDLTIENADLTIADYKVNWGDGVTDLASSYVYSHTYTTIGSKTVVVTATSIEDPSTYKIKEQDIAIGSDPTPNVGISGVPSWVYLSEPIVATIPDPTENATYTWNWGNGATTSGTYTSSDPSIATAPYTYPGTGEFQILLEAVSENGTTNSIAHNVSVIADPVPMPTLTFAYIDEESSGRDIRFDASGSYMPDGSSTNISYFEIVYGDDGSSVVDESNTSGIFYHSYDSAGSFPVMLYVYDDATPTPNYNVATVTVPTW